MGIVSQLVDRYIEEAIEHEHPRPSKSELDRLRDFALFMEHVEAIWIVTDNHGAVDIVLSEEELHRHERILADLNRTVVSVKRAF